MLDCTLCHDSLFLAAETLGEVFSLSEQERMGCLGQLMSPRQYQEAACRHLRRFQEAELLKLGGEEHEEVDDASLPLAPTDLQLASEAGIVLPKKEVVSATTSFYVRVTTRSSALRRVALAVATGQPLAVGGQPGTGKTAIVEHFRSGQKKLLEAPQGFFLRRFLFNYD